MTNNIKNITPEIADGVAIYSFDKQTFLLQTTFSHQLRINISTHNLLKLIDGKRNIDTITATYNTDSTTKISVQDVYQILYEKLAKWGVIKHDIPVLKRQKDGYLLLRFTIIPEKVLSKITPLFSSLFNIKSFYILFFLLGLSAILNFYILSIQNFHYQINPKITLWLYGAVAIIVLLHELGHATACQKFGAKHGGIGFGFYLFMPVCYADVTDAWKLSKHQRIIIDFAGVFMDFITINISILAFYIFKIPVLAYIPFLVGFNILMNLNPFFRFDGYWVLADGLGIPNLRTDAMNKIMEIIQFKKSIELNPKNIFLTIYGAFSWAFLGIFLGFVVFYQSSSLWLFPTYIFNIVKHCIKNPENITLNYLQSNLTTVIIPIMFYITVWNLFRKKVISLKDFLLKTIQ